MEHFQLFGIFLTAFGHTQIGIESEGDTGGTQLLDKKQTQCSIGDHFLDAVLTQCFGRGLRGGGFSIAVQTALGREVGGTGHPVGLRLGTSPVHFNITHNQEPAFGKFKTCCGVTDGKSDAVVERVVVGGNPCDQRGGGHDWTSLTVTGRMSQGLRAGPTVGHPIWVSSS